MEGLIALSAGLILLSCFMGGVVVAVVERMGRRFEQEMERQAKFLWALSAQQAETTSVAIDAVARAMLSRTSQEAVEADGLRKQWDIANQNLADAYAKAEATESRKQPKWVTTADGDKIDLNEYDLV